MNCGLKSWAELIRFSSEGTEAVSMRNRGHRGKIFATPGPHLHSGCTLTAMRAGCCSSYWKWGLIVTYSFAFLSPADFEDLGRDLIGRSLSYRFEAFGPGPDGGIDGRHAASDNTNILQAKHYRSSKFAGLKRQMRRERAAIDRLAPDRYILATSVSLIPGNKSELAKIIGPSALLPEC